MDTILLLLISFILLRLLDISRLFCDISIRCSFVVVKYDVDKVVTCSLRSSTSLKRSLFTIVAEPYRPVELIDIYIYYNNRKKLEIFLLTSWFMGGRRDEGMSSYKEEGGGL